MEIAKKMKEFYETNKDFERYVNECIKTYGRELDYMLQTRIVESYYEYLIEELKGKNENQ